ncbi:hypothetical protein [Snodgrassella alvi]|uniref:Uncharacterized protein n=1 Tax=Snodgrassella alvi TaxID=1196083 RepID=A0A2N9X672_9NEIS|nr:hypothetical protein [Snodgrassella alvi]PIT38675.1 hypothetical protein BHC54_09170 [Snodgrassella alvi]
MNNVVSENNTVDISKILDDILKDENYKNDDESLFKCVFSRIEPKVIIKIEGRNYHSSFPASFAQSLVEIQDNFYRAVSIALFGEENLKRLNSDHRARFQLTFSIENGSTEVESDFKNSLINLVSTAMVDMSPKLKAGMIVALALIASGTFIAWKHLQANSENTKEIEQTKRLNFAIEKMAENNEKNINAILRGVKDADKATINHIEYSKADIEDANRRAERVAHTLETFTGEFKIYGVETKHEVINKFTLSNKETGEFSALFDEDQFKQDDIDKIWDAVKYKRVIKLTLSLDKQENKIKQSTILSID